MPRPRWKAVSVSADAWHCALAHDLYASTGFSCLCGLWQLPHEPLWGSAARFHLRTFSDISWHAEQPRDFGATACLTSVRLAPAGTRVTISSVSSDVKVTGVKGELSVGTVSGDVTLTNVGNLTEAKTASGDVVVNGAESDGTLEVATLSGDVRLTHVKARRLQANTVSGDVTADDVEPMNWVQAEFARTVSGVDYALALAVNYAYRREVQQWWADGWDLLVTPTLAEPPTRIGDEAVTSTEWYPEAGLLRFQLGDSMRLQVRPSGTEPKVKLYGEGIDEDPAELVEQLAALLVG
mgnify:CR=1 FL=1